MPHAGRARLRGDLHIALALAFVLLGITFVANALVLRLQGGLGRPQ